MVMKYGVGALLLAASTALAGAQESGSTPPAAPATGAQQSGEPASGTKPENMGSTGWTGPHKGRQTGTTNARKNQPLTATGVDLKGPPTRFAPSETPQ